VWKTVATPIFAHEVTHDSPHAWRYDEIRKLVRFILFADIPWKEGTKEWKTLSENRSFIEFAHIALALRGPDLARSHRS
jgi:hypothetical protein